VVEDSATEVTVLANTVAEGELAGKVLCTAEDIELDDTGGPTSGDVVPGLSVITVEPRTWVGVGKIADGDTVGVVGISDGWLAIADEVALVEIGASSVVISAVGASNKDVGNGAKVVGEPACGEVNGAVDASRVVLTNPVHTQRRKKRPVPMLL